MAGIDEASTEMSSHMNLRMIDQVEKEWSKMHTWAWSLPNQREYGTQKIAEKL